MAFIPVDNTYMVELRMLCAGQNIENTLYFRPTVENDDPSPAALGAAMLLWWNAQLANALPVEVSLREVYVTSLESVTGAVHTQPAPTPAPAGARPGAVLPNNVTLCVSFRTALRGRSFRGRNYVAAFTEDDVTQSQVHSDVQGDLIAAYNALLAAPIVGDWEWVVVSRFSAGAPRVAGVATPVVSVVIVDDVVDSQRRRLPGRGT